MTQAIATFGVYGPPSEDERDVLMLANEYRQRLCELLHERHRAVIDYRNERFPFLIAALERLERAKYHVSRVEREIKEYHSKIRDRNAVTVQQRATLNAARAERTASRQEASGHRKAWADFLKGASIWRQSLCDWKNVKSLAKRRDAYAAIDWPDEYAAYGAMWTHYDLLQRELSVEYQQRGLHASIRAEIVEASKPKLSKTGPGMRYQYGRRLDIRPWTKITLQIGGGGLRFSDAIAGVCPSLRITPIYSTHKARCIKTVVEVEQQIGTADHPRRIVYRAKLHRRIHDDAIIKRWSLVVDGRRRTCIPILSEIDMAKPTQAGATLQYKLSWTSIPQGVVVASFRSTRVNETLTVPRWLVRRLMRVKPTQVDLDNTANDMLEERGISRSKKPGSLHGVASLEVYCEDHPEDNAAANALHDMRREMRVARSIAARARRCLEKIYETVARRVCSLHDSIVPDTLDLTRIKRYDTRDLLTEDPLPPASREILSAVSPGKLKASLLGYGLARAEAAVEIPEVARETDVFTSWVGSLAVCTGSKRQHPARRSQHATAIEVAQ